MTRRCAALVLALSATALLAACDGTSTPDGGTAGTVTTGSDTVGTGDTEATTDGPADVTGTVAVTGSRRSIVDVSDDYYEGMGLGGSDTPVELPEGPGTVADLAAGDEVEVWVTDMCAESYPVQCGVLAVRVVG